MNQVFEVCDRKWRGVGSIPKSGYKLRYEFREHDAERLFDVKEIDTQEPAIVHQWLVLTGREEAARLHRRSARNARRNIR